MAEVCNVCHQHLPIGPSAGDFADAPVEVAWETVCCQVASDVRGRRSFDYIEERLIELGVTDPGQRREFWEGLREAAGGVTAPKLGKILAKLGELGCTHPGHTHPDPHPEDGEVAHAAGHLSYQIMVDTGVVIETAA